MTADLFHSPEQQQHIEKEKLNQIVEFDKLLNDLDKVMTTPHGRRVINWIMRISKPYQDHFDPNSPHVTARNLGQAYVGIQLHQAISKKCPELLSQMAREYESTKQSTNKRG